MAGTAPVVRVAGPTVCLSVVATSHAAVTVAVDASALANYLACINPGAAAVAIRVSQTGTAATLPVDGTPGDYILPPLMQDPVFLALPTITPKVTAIATGAGPTLIYVTPVLYQS